MPHYTTRTKDGYLESVRQRKQGLHTVEVNGFEIMQQRRSCHR